MTHREEKPSRYRKARSDATVGAIIASIQRTFELPDGCIQIVAPSGQKIRIDARIKRVREKWK